MAEGATTRIIAEEAAHQARGINCAIYYELRGPHRFREFVRQFSNWELAALDACFRATPFNSYCSDRYHERWPDDEAIAAIYEENSVISRHEGERCWALPQFEVIDETAGE